MVTPTPREHTPAVRAVLLPGSGSDADFLHRAFGPALTGRGIELIAVDPQPRGVVAGYRAALQIAAETAGDLLVGGVSLGAIVAARWALDHQHRLRGLLLALPPWIGAPKDAPAARSATFSAGQLRQRGLAAVLHDIGRSSPPWLATELTRAWQRQWPALPQALDEAAAQHAPTEAELQRLHLPSVIVAARDDPVHPVTVGRAWADASPNAHLATIALDELGADPAVLGAACMRAWPDLTARSAR